MNVIMIRVIDDVTIPANCQFVMSLGFLFPHIIIGLSTLLVAIRTIAIWNKEKAIVAVVTGLWIVNVAFLIQGVARIRSKRVAVLNSCTPPNTESDKASMISVLVTNFILFSIMLGGLFSLRRQGGGLLDLGRLLLKQGVIWLLLAVVAELMPVVRPIGFFHTGSSLIILLWS